MSVVRRCSGEQVLEVTDSDGDRLEVEAFPSQPGDFLVVIRSGDEEHVVGLDLDDGLAFLSFLADALGVERYVPGGAG